MTTALNTSAYQEELTRFEGVINSRTSGDELVGLVGKLHESRKFSNAAKPYCYVLLMRALGRRLPDRYLPQLLGELQRFNVVELLEYEVEENLVDEVCGMLVKRALSRVERATPALLQVIRDLEASGLARDRSSLIHRGLTAGMDENLVGQICDLTFEAYYGLNDA